MASEMHCTQFTEPFPDPGTGDSDNLFLLVIITTIVKAYRPYHYYILSSLIYFSFFANILIVIVLLQKEMRNSGINVTMMLIAVCDFGCSVSALLQQLLRNYSDNYSSFFTAYSQLLCDYLAVAFHASSLYLAAGMAFCRIMSMSISNRNRNQWQTPTFAWRLAIVLFFPIFISSSVVMFINSVKKSENVHLESNPLFLQDGCFYLKTVLIGIGFCFKIFPCVAMLIFSILLLRRIENGKKHSNNITNNQKDKNVRIDRSTRFIQIVLVIFLITEIPQGILNIMGGIFVVDYHNYYQNLSIFMNVLAFLNTTTSFIIYSTLSSKFRKLFSQLFLPRTITELLFRRKRSVNHVLPSSIPP